MEDSFSGKQTLTLKNWSGDLLFVYLIKYYKESYANLSALADSLSGLGDSILFVGLRIPYTQLRASYIADA